METRKAATTVSRRNRRGAVGVSLAVCALLVGCASEPANTPAPASLADTLARFTRAPQARLRTGELRAVQIPREAPWLAHTVQTVYTGQVSARAAIAAILDKNPVRYELDAAADTPVYVSAPANAVTVQDHLAAIVTQANWDYRIENDVVIVTDWLTKTYPLAIGPGEQDGTLGVAPVSQTDSAGAGDTDLNQNQLTVDYNPYADLNATLAALLGRDPGVADTAMTGTDDTTRRPRFAVSQASNAVIVSASPNQHREIARALDAYNASVGQTVLLDVAVYNIEHSEGQQRAIDLDLLRAAGVEIVAGSTHANTLGIENLPQFFRLNFTDNNRTNGSSLIARALALHGNTSIVTRGQLEAKNNQITNLQDANGLGFLDYSFADGTIEGRLPRFSESIIQVLPTVHGEQIHLRVIVINNEVEPYIKSVTLATQASGATDTTTPEIEAAEVRFGKQYVFPVALGHGETVLIAGLQTDTHRQQKSRNWLLPWLGDAVDASTTRSETVVVMTAHLL